jgi:RNA polymerase sigma-70 factor (ECF subfamily)
MITKLLLIHYKSYSSENLMKVIQSNQGVKGEAAFQQLYDNLASELLSYIYYLVKNKQIAQELANDSFFALYSSRDSFDCNRSLKAWLWRIARNKAYNQIKKHCELPLEPEELDNIKDSNSINLQLENIINREDRLEIKQAMNMLPLSQREALELWSQDFELKQIGQLMNKSEQAIKNLVHRGKVRLIKYFKDNRSTDEKDT